MAVTFAVLSASVSAIEINIDQIKTCLKSTSREHNPFVDIMRLPGTSLRRAVATAESLARVTFYYIERGSQGSKAGGYIELKSLSDPPSVTTLALKPGEYRVETKLAPGKYSVRAFSKDGLVAPPRILHLASDLDNVPIHLGEPNLPYIRMGFGLIPVRPSEETIAIVFENGGVPGPELKKAIESLTQKLAMELVPIKFDDKDGYGTQHHSIWLYRIRTGIDRESLFKELWANVPRSIRVGIPVDWEKDILRVVDNRYVVRFSPDLVAKKRIALLDELGLRKFREYKGDPDLWVVEFPRAQIAENIQTINCLVENNVLMTGEPDLVVNFFYHDGFRDGWPNDPRYKYQRPNHDHQQIREAWRVLHERNNAPLSPSIGNSMIYIGVVDGPINPGNVEIACNTGASNSTQLELCFDPAKPALTSTSGSTLGNCSDEPVTRDEGHGMAMLGVISACADNGEDIAGMAPGTHQLSVRMPMDTSTDYYSNILLWIGGQSISCPTPDNPNDPCHWTSISHPADVINCSHGFTAPGNYQVGSPLLLPEVIATSFQILTTQGRSGKGAVLVYSAGNATPSDSTPDAGLIEIYEPLAADFRTLAISNCAVSDDGSEGFFKGDGVIARSGYGRNIDICALGHNSQTIPPWCDTSGTCVVGGTSAAAATVSAAVGLVLSANPALTWEEVRKLLRSTADQIDPNQQDVRGRWIDGRSEWYGSGRLNFFRAVDTGSQIATIPEREEEGERPSKPNTAKPSGILRPEIPESTSPSCDCRM